MRDIIVGYSEICRGWKWWSAGVFDGLSDAIAVRDPTNEERKLINKVLDQTITDSEAGTLRALLDSHPAPGDAA